MENILEYISKLQKSLLISKEYFSLWTYVIQFTIYFSKIKVTYGYRNFERKIEQRKKIIHKTRI